MTLSKKFLPAIPIFFVLLWSTGFLGATYSLPFIEPFYLLAIRMSLTVLVLVLLCLMLRVQWPSRREVLHQMVTGALIHGCYLGGVFASIKLGLATGITAVVVGTQPLLTALLAGLFLGERVTARQWLGLCLGCIGVVTVMYSGNGVFSSNIDPWAFVCALVALAGISVGTLYQKRFGATTSLLAGSMWQYVSAGVIMALLAWGFETRVVEWSGQLLLALIWLIFGLSIAAILLLMFMIRQQQAARVSSYFYMVTPVVALESWLLFDETLPLVGVLAIGVVVLGVYLVITPKRKAL